jgi:hypothetical protein
MNECYLWDSVNCIPNETVCIVRYMFSDSVNCTGFGPVCMLWILWDVALHRYRVMKIWQAPHSASWPALGQCAFYSTGFRTVCIVYVLVQCACCWILWEADPIALYGVMKVWQLWDSVHCTGQFLGQCEPAVGSFEMPTLLPYMEWWKYDRHLTLPLGQPLKSSKKLGQGFLYQANTLCWYL